ncbi:MAG: uroporphyrinogen-III C-methyltransferase [Acidimicrobiaceae bacterium]|nr:uroporphyrinogen-III C-methyltransferase [Acidimicrobiaceae bacterium]
MARIYWIRRIAARIMAEDSGTVYLVGAGPGDPGLLTVRGKELLNLADIVVFDYLSDDSLLEFCRPEAELIDVGKRPGRPVPQNEINEVLIRSAARAKTVVRLKGGDPFVFGRGGEEALALIEAGISFEVVPGISSSIAVPAYAGVPVTHRGLSTSFTVVTGHRHGSATDQVDWESLAKLGGTIVVLMGVAHRAEISEKLISGGLSPYTPVAAVRWGTRSDQVSVRTNLQSLGEAEILSPSVIVIGAVAGLDLAWFEKRPLLGKKIVVTRAKTQSRKLIKAIRDLGGQVLSIPAIQIGPPADNYQALARAARDISGYKWLIFTSANSVPLFFDLLRDTRDLAGVKVAAIGDATAREIARFNIVADFVPSSFVAETFVAEFPEGCGKILLPRAEMARDLLPVELAKMGWNVDVVEAYRTEIPVMDETLADQIAASDAITFTSSSTVSNFLSRFGVMALPARVISIGPVTRKTLEEFGVSNSVMADTHNIDGLLEVLVASLSP